MDHEKMLFEVALLIGTRRDPKVGFQLLRELPERFGISVIAIAAPSGLSPRQLLPCAAFKHRHSGFRDFFVPLRNAVSQNFLKISIPPN